MKTIDIKGKAYVTVAERVKFFNEKYPNGSIRTELKVEENLILCRAVVIPDIEKMDRMFTGYAEEDRTISMVNKTSAVENAETSAVGRALGMMGIGIVDSIASADEVNKAVNRESAYSSDKGASEAQLGLIKKLSKDLGIEPPPVKTIAEASALITDLAGRVKKLKVKDEPFEG